MAKNRNTHAQMLAELTGDVDTRPGFRAQLRQIVENASFKSVFREAKVVLFDDFLGDLLADEYSGAGGSDPQALAPAINAQIGGVVRLTSGDVGGGDDAVDASVLSHALNWQASNGDLVLEARVKMSAITDISVFVGFTDQLATTAVEHPLEVSGTTVNDNANDAVGFVFDTGATVDQWHGAGTKAGTATALSAAGGAPVADTYNTLRVEVDDAGSARFYVDGTYIGGLANAVTAGTDLTPTISVMARTTTAHTLDVDYWLVEMDRA